MIRSLVLGLPVLVFLEQHPSLVVEFQKIFHVPGALGSPVHFHVYYLVSASHLGSAFPGFCPRRPAAGQVVLVAKACPRLGGHRVLFFVPSCTLLLKCIGHVCSAP